MDKRAVQDFYLNKAMREAVRDYIFADIQEQAVEMVFKREDVSHIADAAELIDQAFKKMDTEFNNNKTNTTINEAR